MPQQRGESRRSTCAEPGINETVIYAVCTECAFLRAYSSAATDAGRLDACPACGGELLIRQQEGRFPPAYVSRVSRELLGAPELPTGPDVRPA
jgi:hypothetical protein